MKQWRKVMNERREIDFKFAPHNAQACIGLVDDYYKTIVWDEGSVCFDYSSEADPYYYFRLKEKVQSLRIVNRGFNYRFRPKMMHGDRLLSLHQDYHKPEEAIITTIENYEHSSVEWTVFAWEKETGTRADVIIWKIKALEGFVETRSGMALETLGAEPRGFSIHSCEKNNGVQRSNDKLKPGSQLEGAFFILHQGELVEEDITYDTALEAYKWCQSYWEKVKPFVNKFQVPDKQVMDMLTACGRNILQAREVKKGILNYQVGPTCYRGLWILDGLFILDAVHMMGRSQEAFRGVSAVLNYIHEDGSISAIPYHDKETAVAMFTIARQCSLMDDDDYFEELWPILSEAYQYIRKRVNDSKAYGNGYPGYGLWPPSFGDGGINGLEPEYTTPIWAMIGLKAVSEYGRKLSLAGWDEILQTYIELRQSFNQAMDRDRKTTDKGIAYVPVSMVTHEEFEEHIQCAERYNIDGEISNLNGYSPQCGTWAFAQGIAVGELLQDDDDRVLEFLKLLESTDHKQGIPQDTGWMTEDSIWTYSSMFYAQAFLYCGYGEKAIDYLYSFANHASPARCWREEQTINGSNNYAIWGDMPHNWGSAEFIRLVRNAIVLEKDQNLELMKGLTDQWLPNEAVDLVISNTPTVFGLVTI